MDELNTAIEEENVSPVLPEIDAIPQTKKGKRKRRLLFLAFSLFCLAVVALTAVKEFGSSATAERIPLSQINVLWLLPAFGAFGIVLGSEVCKYFALIRHATGEKRLGLAYSVSVFGKYYDNITPFGAGGQPFQMYYLRKAGLPVGQATAIPLIGFLGTEFSFVLLAITFFIVNGQVTDQVGFVITACVGIGAYLFLPTLIVLFTIFPKPIGSMVFAVIRLAGRIRLVKDPEAKVASVDKELGNYRAAIISVAKDWKLVLKVMIFSLFYEGALMSIPFFVLHMFGGSATFLDAFTMSLFVYASVTIVPTPGNAGAAEGAFYMLFSELSSARVFWAMLVWRFFVYYMMLILGLLCMLWQYIRKKIDAHRGTAGTDASCGAQPDMPDDAE